MKNDVSLEGQLSLFREMAKEREFGDITNHRPVVGKDYQTYQEYVLSGKNKILDFIHRGISIQVKNIKQTQTA